MSKETRFKLFYSGELILIAIVFLVLGILELLKVIVLSDNFQLFFRILTLVGASWLTFDFFFTLLNKKRRKNKGMLDKSLMLPLAIYLYSFDIAGFVVNRPYEYYQIGVPMAFFYISCVYIFQGIYHFFRPTNEVLEALLEDEEILLEEKTKEEQKQAEQQEENKEDEK